MEHLDRVSRVSKQGVVALKDGMMVVKIWLVGCDGVPVVAENITEVVSGKTNLLLYSHGELIAEMPQADIQSHTVKVS